MRLKGKYVVLIFAGSNVIVDSVEDSFDEAFSRARVIRRSMLEDGDGLPVGIARIEKIYD